MAGFAGLMRVFDVAFTAYAVDWQPLIAGVAVATMLVGAVLAVVQTDVKRMMAYSSISHAGFVLVGVQAATDKGVEAALFYLATYVFLVAGSSRWWGAEATVTTASTTTAAWPGRVRCWPWC